MSDLDLALRPPRDEYGDAHVGYLAVAPDGHILETLRREGESALALYAGLSEAQSRQRYAPGKWSIREVLGHVADSERVFAYRALRFGRGDRTPLPGFDQDVFVPHSRADERPWPSLIADFAAVRAATLSLLESFGPADWLRTGEASGCRVSVRAIAWILAGHEAHHRRILRERYLAG